MKKCISTAFFVLLLVSMILIFPAGCSSEPAGIISVDDEGNTDIDQSALESVFEGVEVQKISDEEGQGIQYMREEEKLARDVYLALYDMWNTKTFKNIGSSEQTHMEAISTLLDRYNLEDPAQGKGRGEFTNQTLQQLYDSLVAEGGQSEIGALKVGAAIEEIDIVDLEEYVSQTDQADIITVYEYLLKGSRNHLRSFVSVMEKRGVEYSPQFITESQYNGIISSEMETGGG